jgi:hypothetical protein
VNIDIAKAQHTEFRTLLRAHGVRVLTVREILAYNVRVVQANCLHVTLSAHATACMFVCVCVCVCVNACLRRVHVLRCVHMCMQVQHLSSKCNT